MRRWLILVVSLAVIGSACSGGDEAGIGASTDLDTPTTTAVDEPEETTTTETAIIETTTTAAETTTTNEPTSTVDPAFANLPGAELIGRWAHYDVVAYEDGLLKTLIVSYGFNEFSIVDGEVIDSVEFCYSEQRSDQPFESSLSDAATQAIKPPDTPVEVEEADGALRLRRPATPTPVGIRLDDPANESLPTDPNDPRIVDDDGDGNPGVTVTIDVGQGIVGEIYIARREIFSYDALLTDPDTITGTVTDTSEQLIIGASNELFLTGDANWVQHPNLDRSPIILKRVAADWDCDRLVAERSSLFPPTPEADW